MRLAVSSAMVLLLVLLAWSLVPHRSPRSSALVTVPGAGVASATISSSESVVDALPDESTRSLASDTLATGTAPEVRTAGHELRVRSSIGLALPFVEWQTQEGEWRRVDLDQGRCDASSLTLPCDVRAPGHVAQVVQNTDDELVLVPDALLILDAAGLRTRTHTIRVQNHFARDTEPLYPALRRACACGFLSDDSWAAAVSHDLIEDKGLEGEFMVEILWPDHHRADVRFVPLEGARAKWDVPCGGSAPSAPLHVHVERPAGESVGDVLLYLKHTGPNPHAGPIQRFSWGSAYIYPSEILFMDEPRLLSGATDFTFDVVPTGVSLSLAARDEASSAYGRLVFVHDGSPRTLPLLPGFTLAGRLAADDDSSAVNQANVFWEFEDNLETNHMWRFGTTPPLIRE